MILHRKVSSIMGPLWASPFIYIWMQGIGDNPASTKYSMIGSICSHIWREWNSRIFRNEAETHLDSLFIVYYNAVLWSGLIIDEESALPTDTEIPAPFMPSERTIMAPVE